MIISHTEVQLKRALDHAKGNVQTFMDRLLVEVASENYRYFLTECLAASRGGETTLQAHCWPPLLSNERQVSGLFAIGLSRVSPISIPEHPISREHKAADDVEPEIPNKKGRIDFLAYHGTRHVALELKRCPISTLGDARSKAGLTNQWNSVKRQSEEALAHMREIKEEYDSPVSVGLLVIRVSRKVTSRIELEKARQNANDSLPSVVDSISKLTKADYLSYYIAPKEMQISYGWGKNENEYSVFPGVVFAAVVHGNVRR
jgi:hypothetical protein